MLRCVFGHRWDNLPAQLPSSTGTTLQRFLGFLIFWAVELPFCSLRPTKLRWLYTAKAWLLPPSVLGLLIYCVVQSRGRLASNAELSGTSESLSRSALVWAIVSSVNSAMGNWVRISPYRLSFISNLQMQSTFIANMPDFARYSTDPSATMWTHIVFVPFPAAVVSGAIPDRL